jgi:aminoglycoside phosphotransferase (APT) family kinase protein
MRYGSNWTPRAARCPRWSSGCAGWRCKPVPSRVGVVHGDLRLGNFIVGDEGLRAIVDWEFWHLGDPVEDFAWLCARPWRFGNDDKPAAGLGGVEELLDGFGAAVDPARLRWWDVISQVKWGAYCARQAALRREGAHASLERTVLARRVAEAEWDMLELIEAAGLLTRPPIGEAGWRAEA